MKAASSSNIRREPAKEKSKTLPRPRSLHPRRPLIASFVLILAWFGLFCFSMPLLRYHKFPTLYPLLLAVNSKHQGIVVLLLVMVVLGLHGLALYKGFHRGWTALSLCLQAGLLVIALVFASWPMVSLTHVSTLWKDGRAYHLVHNQDGGSWNWGSQSYLVLECDLTGLICAYYSTPYSVGNACFGADGYLAVDPTTQRLVLWVRTASYNLQLKERELDDEFTSYPVEPNADNGYGYGMCPVRGLTR